MKSNHGVRLFTCLIWGNLLVGCTDAVHGNAAAGGFSATRIFPPVALLDDTGSILARPLSASMNATGSFFVADASDKNIKVYGADGHRSGTIGRAGSGPGEFRAITSAQVMRDSLVVCDFAQRKVTVFDEAGRPIRSFGSPPGVYAVQVVDDSLLLLVHLPGGGGKVLTLARLDGSHLNDFMDLEGFYRDPQLKFLSGLIGDARGGFVFANVFGEDSLYVFDYQGRMVASGPIPAVTPPGSMRRALELAGGKTTSPDGTWFHQGMRTVMRIVALDGARAVLQLAPYDTKVGTDLVEGGEILVVGVRDGGIVRLDSRIYEAGLFGRSWRGDPLFLRYTDSVKDAVAIVRWELQ